MVNKYYRRGANFEREIVKQAKEKGLIAFRSAGSHSPIDVCVINPDTKELFLIQCKCGKFSEYDLTKLHKKLEFLQGTYKVFVQVEYKDVAPI